MANESLFLTKDGVSLPAVTEMSTSALAGYQNDLTLPLIKNTTHTFNVFQMFKFRGSINENVAAEFVFNGVTNYTPSFVTGSGSLNTSNGRITPISTPLAVEKANTVFLTGAIFAGHQLADGDDVAVRIASLTASYLASFNIDNHLITFADASTATPSSYTEPANITIEIAADAINFKKNDGTVVYTVARTYHASVASGAIGVLSSSGTTTGSTLPMDTSDGLVAANSVVTGVLRLTSNLGAVTDYAVTLGAALATTNTTDFLDKTAESDAIVFNAGDAASYDVPDDLVGGVGSISYSISDGHLPEGVHLTTDGTLAGIPVTDGSSNFTIRSVDEFGNTASIAYFMIVNAPANVEYQPPAGTQGKPYSFTPILAGITNATVSSGLLPTGLTLHADGSITGTPTVVGTRTSQVNLTFDGGASELVQVVIAIYSPVAVELFSDNASLGLMDIEPVEVVGTAQNRFAVTGGSGSYQYSISGSNFINSQGEMQIFDAGQITVTVTDTVTGLVTIFSLLVAGQTDTLGLAIVEDSNTDSDKAPTGEIITDCETPVTIAFQAMQLLRGISPTEIVYREYPNFTEMEGASVENNGHPFVMFRSKDAGGWASADNALDGKPFICEFLVDATLANSTSDFFVGITKDFTNHNETELGFACVITTVSGVRKVEIRKDNVYQGSSRFSILEGQQIGFAVFPDSITLYIDGIAQFTMSSVTFACSGVRLIFLAKAANLICGGKANNLIFDIATLGSSTEVGTINPQTGLYTPSTTNVGLVRVEAVSTHNAAVKYIAAIRIISGAPKTSLENAMIEGIPVDVWVCETERKDNLPLRLDRDGRPDKSQLSNPQHLGTLQAAAKMTAAMTRQDFRNDRGATSSSLVIDKVTIAGGYLAVRNMPLVKRLVPYMKELNRGGVRTLQQFSTGCHKRLRIILVWQTADCSDVPVFDAIEFHSGLSYTMFDLEIGQGVQSNLPISIEAFPNDEGVIYEYNQFDKHFHRIGAGS